MKRTTELFKADEEQQLIYGVVLVPDQIDLQGDIISKEEIQLAAHDYLVESRKMKLQHRVETDGAEVVESYIAQCDTPIGNGIAPAGSWIMVTHVLDSRIWEAVKAGDFAGYSIGGTGTREEL